jgi:hypothetical protein
MLTLSRIVDSDSAGVCVPSLFAEGARCSVGWWRSSCTAPGLQSDELLARMPQRDYAEGARRSKP